MKDEKVESRKTWTKTRTCRWTVRMFVIFNAYKHDHCPVQPFVAICGILFCFHNNFVIFCAYGRDFNIDELYFMLDIA